MFVADVQGSSSRKALISSQVGLVGRLGADPELVEAVWLHFSITASLHSAGARASLNLLTLP